MPEHPFIRLENIHKSFGEKQVLRGFNLEINKNESMVIMGGSGSGKSVLLKILLGLLIPDEGKVFIDNIDVTHFKPNEREQVNRKFGMLFQNAALFDSLLVWENVAFGLMSGHRMKRKQAFDIAIEKLSLVGLGADVAMLAPAELSGGMRKRVGLARAIAGDPEILLCDEPTTGLDPIMGHIIDDLIVKSVKKLGATGVTITHDMASAKRIADRMAMLYKGQSIWTGASMDMDASGNDFVDQFVKGKADGPIQMELKRL